MSRPAFRDRRFWLLLAALGCLAGALAAPHLPLTRPTYRLLIVVDITGSMNTRDLKIAGKPVGRLDYVKQVLGRTLGALPCQSQAGLALFTERRSFLLMEPIEICANFAAMSGTISRLEWRMAWEGDSYVASGLSHAITLAESLGSDLVFLTDGQEAPPLPEGWEDRFEPGNGKAKGLIAGVGGFVPSPIPKFDPTGREVGFYNADDVPHESRIGAPPKGAEQREGWHPRNAPFGANAPAGNEHLSSVREDHLKDLAARTGLTYAHLEDADALVAAIQMSAIARPVSTPRDVSAIPATLALLLLLLAYLPPAVALSWLRGQAQLSPRKGLPI